MKFVKCKNESDKLSAIASYCHTQIENNNANIASLKMDQATAFDYADEIHGLEKMNAHFLKIMDIVQADEFKVIVLDK